MKRIFSVALGLFIAFGVALAYSPVSYAHGGHGGGCGGGHSGYHDGGNCPYNGNNDCPYYRR